MKSRDETCHVKLTCVGETEYDKWTFAIPDIMLTEIDEL